LTLAEAVSLAQSFVSPKKCTKPRSRKLKVDPKIENKWFSLRRKIWQKKSTKLGQKYSSQSSVLTENPIDAEKIDVKNRISRVKLLIFFYVTKIRSNLTSNLSFVTSCNICFTNIIRDELMF